MPRDRRARLVQALRAIGDLPEQVVPGAFAWWTHELTAVTGWRLIDDQLVSPDGRTWRGVSLEQVARILEGEAEG